MVCPHLLFNNALKMRTGYHSQEIKRHGTSSAKEGQHKGIQIHRDDAQSNVTVTPKHHLVVWIFFFSQTHDIACVAALASEPLTQKKK